MRLVQKQLRNGAVPKWPSFAALEVEIKSYLSEGFSEYAEYTGEVLVVLAEHVGVVAVEQVAQEAVHVGGLVLVFHHGQPLNDHILHVGGAAAQS